MATRPRVAVLRTQPDTVLQDIDRLLGLAEVGAALDASRPTILKDNISWHFPFPGANTTPWQLEGSILALRKAGFQDLVCVQNKTVVTNAFKGEDLNRYVPIFERHSIPVLYNFRDADMKWVEYKPKAKMLVLDRIFPEGIRIPDYFLGKNIVHLPTVKCVAGDTRVQLADGTVIAIAELFTNLQARSGMEVHESDGDRRIRCSVPIVAMSADGQVGPHPATWVWRTHLEGRRLLRLRTRTGRTLLATADHPLLTPGGWRALGDLQREDRIAIARRVAVQGISQCLPQTNAAAAPVRPQARPGKKFQVAFARRVIDAYADGRTVTAIADQEGVRWQSIQALLRRHGVPLRRNRTRLRIPERTSADFWRWIGYVMAEGCVEGRKQGSRKLWWTNTTPELRADFRRITHELFGIEARVHGKNPGMQRLENEWGHVTPRIARSLLATLESADAEAIHREAIDAMRVLASPDLAWDAVESIEAVDDSGVELFDVTVPSAGSFVGNGIVLHNCHIYTTTTGAMKNAFGGLLNTKRHYTHSWIHATLVDLLAIQKEIHSGIFAVMDGTTAGNGPGPRTMFPVVKNVMLASADQVAIDAVAAAMMGFDPLQLDFIRLAHEAGLGVGRPSDIEIVGDQDAAAERWGFRVGDNSASRVGDLLWFGPLKSIQKLFFRTPLVNLFIFGSEAYHDFYRWPAKDRATFEKWRRETAWGRLFDRYAASAASRAPAEEPAAR